MSSAFTARPEIRGTFGVVSSTHWLASQVAMGVLERGGNAFDAAAAGGFALQIVEPHLNGPGGEVPILFWSEDEQRMRAMRPGTGARAGDAGLFPWPGSGPGARHRPVAGNRAGRLQRLAHAAARLRHLGAGRRARACHCLCPRRLSIGAAHLPGHPGGAGPVPRRMDQLGRGLAAQWPRAGAGRAVPHARHRSHLHTHRGTGAGPGP